MAETMWRRSLPEGVVVSDGSVVETKEIPSAPARPK